VPLEDFGMESFMFDFVDFPVTVAVDSNGRAICNFAKSDVE
jgi:tartrate dehydratase beta subunit/fumarate hydratase class I family protein